MRFPIGPKLGGAVVLMLIAGTARAENFHVESKVYKVGDKRKKPITEITTVFSDDVVYDFLTDPQGGLDPETTIFDVRRGRLIVLDPQRKVMTEVATKTVQEFLNKVRIEAAGSKDPLLNFLSNPEFKESEHDGELEFDSPWMIYRLKTEPAKSDEISRQYGEFSHWSCQMNLLINPGTLPPFGRMVVSEKLEERKVLPTEVYMTIAPKGPTPKLILRAEHRFVWKLLDKDRDLVNEAQRQMKIFHAVSTAEYNDRLKQGAAEVSQAAKGKSQKQK
jgi:hypothetical protein